MKVRKAPDSDCLEWQSTKDAQGYGRFSMYIDGKQKWFSAHRLVWEWAMGPIPTGLCVCHRCDNPSCVNLEHLFLGTHKDNALDRDRKGRRLPPLGESNGRARLSVADVIDIRRNANPDRGALAGRYGVSRGHINAIIARRTWSDVA